MRDKKVKVDGSIDAGWKSYWESGKTVSSTDSKERKEETSIYPDEVDVDEITDLQKQVVFHSVMNQNYPTDKIGEIIGKDGGYVRATLKRVCPEWYEDVFKQANDGSNLGYNPLLKNVAVTCGKCDEQVVLHDPLDGSPKARCQCTQFELRELPDNWRRDTE